MVTGEEKSALEVLENMSPAERDGILLENAAAEINADKGKKKAEAKPVKKVAKKSAEPNSKNESSNAKKQEPDSRKELERWKAFVTKNNLGLRDSKGEVYLRVEAWNYLFALKGLSATIIDMSRYEDEDGNTLYIAKAALMPMTSKLPEDGVPLGTTAFGACKVGEGIFKDDYSALSMAQTRAIGKLGRTAYAHLAIACGYKATPLEEMKFEEKK